MIALLLILAIVCVLAGAFTAARWLFAVALVLLLLAVFV